MTTGRGAKRAPVVPPRRPLWRRINRHALFVLHGLLFLFLGTWIWTLNAPTLDKQFDALLLLTILAAHGVIVFRNRRIAFLLHLLMFSAGNGAIWANTAILNDKLTVALGWVFVAVASGLWLARRQFTARPLSSPPAERKPRGRKAAGPPPQQDWYEPPQETGWYEAEDASAYAPPPAETEWYDDPQAHSEADYYGDYEAPPEPTKKRGRKKGE